MKKLIKKPDILINFDKQYIVGKFLGTGGYSDVYQVTYNNSKYAAKIIPIKNEKIKKYINREIDIHKNLSHPNIVNLIETFEKDKEIIIIMELNTDSSLNKIIKKKSLSVEEIKKYTIEILKGLKYLHEKYIIHRDIKPGNILIDNTVKICDFGMAISMDSQIMNICGTPNYIAPELLREKSLQTCAIDMWSLGVTIFTMTFRKAPFETDSVENTYDKIRKCDYKFPSEINFLLKDLIQNLIVVNIYDRLTCTEAMNHEFITN